MTIHDAAKENLEKLSTNEYPGRGIIIGRTPDEKNYVQIYWIMGRSANSRNRIFEIDGEDLRTRPYDASKLEDPSLIIYYPARHIDGSHIITNGDQTDTIRDFIKKGSSFEEALQTRQFEPDAPNYTPRISGIITLKEGSASYKLSILKSLQLHTLSCQRNFYLYENFQKGFGHCIHTYRENGSPIPSFDGDPYIVPVENSIEANLQVYWNALNEENRISLLVKHIDCETGRAVIVLKNRNI